MIFMSRKDYLFFNCLGQRYKEKGEEFELSRNFECACQNFSVAGECYGKAEEIAREDMMIEHGVTRMKKEYCLSKASIMSEKSRQLLSSASRHSNK